MIMGRNGNRWLIMVDDGCLGRLGSYNVKMVFTCIYNCITETAINVTELCLEILALGT